MKKQLSISLFVVFFLLGLGIIFLYAQESKTQTTPGVSDTANTPVTTESQQAPAVTETQGTARVSESPNTPVTTESQKAPAVAGTEATPTPPGPEVQWLWGEVVSVDTLTKQTIVKYVDYETDTEKEISINIDDKTTFENAKSLDEIKAQDAVSIDYITNPEGKNIAKNISVEKNEGIQTIPQENKEEPKATPGLE